MGQRGHGGFDLLCIQNRMFLGQSPASGKALSWSSQLWESQMGRGRREGTLFYVSLGKESVCRVKAHNQTSELFIACYPNLACVYFHRPCENAALHRVNLKGALDFTLKS